MIPILRIESIFRVRLNIVSLTKRSVQWDLGKVMIRGIGNDINGFQRLSFYSYMI